MYAIYADDELLYAPDMANLGYIVTDAQLTTEINKAGSLEFTIPVTNPNYNAYSKLKSVIRLEQDGETIWKGRVLDDTKDIDLNKNVMCEGELAFLNDELVRPYDHSSGITIRNHFNDVMNLYATYCSPYRMIRPGNVTMAPDTTVKLKIDSPQSVFDELTSNLVGPNGGYLVIRHANGESYLDYLNAYDQRSNQVLEFGHNIISIDEYIDASDVFTTIVPYGKADDKGNRLTISSVNNGNDWLKSDAGTDLFGHITKAASWDDVEDANTLKTLAQDYLNESVEMATEITISAVDLHLLDVNVDHIDLGDFVHVVSVPHGIDTDFLCSKVVINLQSPDRSQYTFGLVFDAMTDKQVSVKKKSDLSYEMAKDTENSVNSFKNEVYENYVSKAQFENEIDQLKSQIGTNGNVLYGKKYVICGESFSSVYANSGTPYGEIIANRNGMTAVNLAIPGATMSTLRASDCFSDVLYKNVPTDADYITLCYSINDEPLFDQGKVGDRNSTDKSTIWGAWNFSMEYLIEHIPYAKIGIIICDGWTSQRMHDIIEQIATWWGIPWLDLVNDPQVPLGIGGRYMDVSPRAEQLRTEAFQQGPTEQHPNQQAHQYRSTIIENFMRSL